MIAQRYRNWLFPPMTVLVVMSVLIVGCGREALQQQLAGVWETPSKNSRIEFSADSRLTADLAAELTTTVTIRLSDTTKELPANLLGRLILEGSWKPLDNTIALVSLVADIGQVRSDVLLCTAALEGPAGQPTLVLECSLFPPNQRRFQRQATSSPRTDLHQLNEDDLRDRGYQVLDMDMHGVRVGRGDEMLFMTFGAISGGQLDIGQGFTLQKLPQELRVDVKVAQHQQGDNQGQLVFHSSGELFVKAAVKTEEGLMLVTTVEGKTIAYPLFGKKSPYALVEVHAGGQQGIPKGVMRFDAQKAGFTQPQ